MRFSTRARYGLRLCFLLALQQNGEVMPLSVLVRQASLSEKYSEQLLSKLKAAGIIDSVRGASGGYFLTRPPKEINMRAILEALDDGFMISECASGDACDRYCPNRTMMRKLYNEINGLLESMTLQAMVDEQRCEPERKR